VSKEDKKHAQQRIKLLKITVNCEMCMCIVFYKDHVTVSHIKRCSQHSHTLKNLNQFKKSSYFCSLTANQIVSDYKVVKVVRNLCEMN